MDFKGFENLEYRKTFSPLTSSYVEPLESERNLPLPPHPRLACSDAAMHV